MNLLGNAAGTVFLALFGAVYELFGHGVYSYYMIYAFAVPLVLGVLTYTILLISGKYPGRTALDLWNSGITALSIGFVFFGVLEIFGTTNSLCIIFPVSGTLLLAAGLTAEAVRMKKNKKERSQDPPDKDPG